MPLSKTFSPSVVMCLAPYACPFFLPNFWCGIIIAVFVHCTPPRGLSKNNLPNLQPGLTPPPPHCPHPLPARAQSIITYLLLLFGGGGHLLTEHFAVTFGIYPYPCLLYFSTEWPYHYQFTHTHTAPLKDMDDLFCTDFLPHPLPPGGENSRTRTQLCKLNSLEGNVIISLSTFLCNQPIPTSLPQTKDKGKGPQQLLRRRPPYIVFPFFLLSPSPLTISLLCCLSPRSLVTTCAFLHLSTFCSSSPPLVSVDGDLGPATHTFWHGCLFSWPQATASLLCPQP